MSLLLFVPNSGFLDCLCFDLSVAAQMDEDNTSCVTYFGFLSLVSIKPITTTTTTNFQLKQSG